MHAAPADRYRVTFNKSEDNIAQTSEIDGQNQRLKDFFEDQPNSKFLFTQALAQTRMAMCICDPNQDDMPIVFVNRAFCDLTGYKEEEIVGRNCRFLQGPDTSEVSVEEMRRVINQENVGVCEVLNYRKDGTRFWNSIHIGPIYNQEGEIQFFFGSQWDVTDVVAARTSDQQFATIMRELNHRIMNMFAVISSIISLTEKTSDDTRAMAQTVRGRIHALAQAHRASIEAASSNQTHNLAEVIAETLKAHDPDGKGHTLTGPSVEIAPETVLPISMIIFELATNSLKYGSLGKKADPADIRWELVKGDTNRDTDRLKISWTERNNRSDKRDRKLPKSSGSGQNIMQAMANTSNGTMDFSFDPDFVAEIDIEYITAPVPLSWSARGISQGNIPR